MDPLEEFELRKQESIAAQGADQALRASTRDWFDRSCAHRYSYNFSWLGIPIIQYPQDIVALQEVIWSTRPDVIIETGIAHGGSLILSASLLEMIGGKGRVMGIDVDIREHNRRAIEAHPMAKRITMVQGSSTAPETVEQARKFAAGSGSVIVILDSNHTHEHVLEELRLYAPLVTAGSYLVVFDTVIENMPPSAFPDRPWGKGNNPMSAVAAFLGETDRFVVDDGIDAKTLISVAPGGYLRCVR